jgi:hypothetical protein
MAGQADALATLPPAKQSPVTIKWESGRTLELVWAFWRKETPLRLPEFEHRIVQPVALSLYHVCDRGYVFAVYFRVIRNTFSKNWALGKLSLRLIKHHAMKSCGGEWCYGSTHSFPSGIHGGGGQRHDLTAVPPGGSSYYPCLVGATVWTIWEEK